MNIFFNWRLLHVVECVVVNFVLVVVYIVMFAFNVNLVIPPSSARYMIAFSLQLIKLFDSSCPL